MGFAAYIRKQKDRNDPCGDFANDFIRTQMNRDVWIENGDVNELESETLLGFYNHLPNRIGFDDEAFLALVDLWKEWIRYKHTGYNFSEPSNGYVYFFRVLNKNLFKIGKTTLHPEIRKFQVEKAEKLNLEIYNWIKIDFFDLIETELKNAFRKMNYQREFYEFKYLTNDLCFEIDEAIECYIRTSEKYELMKKLDY